MEVGLNKPGTLLGLILLAVLLLSGCTATQQNQDQLPPESEFNTQTIEFNVVAEGEVVPVRFVSLSFPVPGIIEEVYFEEGQMVNEGDVIARLQGKERLQANLAAADLELTSAKKNLNELMEDYELDKANAFFALVKGQQDLEDYLEVRENKEAGRASQDTIDRANAEYNIALKRVEDAEDNYNNLNNRDETNIIRNQALLELAQARQERDRKLRALNWYLGTPDSLELATADADIQVADALLNKLESDYKKLEEGPDPDRLEMAQARLANAEAQHGAARKAINDIELIAPFSGQIAQSDLKKGELFSMGLQTVILADLSSFKIETTDLTELDVLKIAVGDPVLISLDAVPDLVINGRIESIQDFGVNRLGDITYTTVIKMDQQYESIRWKMTASVTFN